MQKPLVSVMKFYKTTKFKIITGILVFLLAGVIFASISGLGTSPLSRVFSICFTPLERISDIITDGLKEYAITFRSSTYYREKAEKLELDNLELMAQLVEYEDMKKRVEAYEQTYGILDENPDYEVVYSTIVARDTADLYSGFTLNKGSLDGVKVGNPVIYGAGNLLGIVNKVSESSCVVSSIIDPGVSIGVYEIRSREDGYLLNDAQSAFGKVANFSGLTSSTVVNEGGIVCSSGVGGKVPRDLIVGTVVSVVNSSTDLSTFATVKPNIDIDNVQNVFIITQFEGQINE